MSLLVAAVVVVASPLSQAAPAGTALDFDGQNDYVTFGDPDALGLSTFTIETWFNRQGPGNPDGTGSGGIANAVPLVTKGTSENDGGIVDMNYYLGIDSDANVLVADFEEGAGGSGPLGQNHPVSGTTVITNGSWHHAAATYAEGTWKLYLDGDLEASLAVNEPPRSDSSQHAGLGTALLSTGAPDSAYFDGVIDEARIWGLARTQAEIQATMDSELTSGTGLVGRWGLNEGSGTSANSSVGSISGTLTNGPLWVDGFVAPPPNAPPAQPTLNTPLDGATDVTTDPTLDVTVADPEGADVTARFFGRPVSSASSTDFTIVAMPDTQHYVDQNGAYLANFTAQVEWIVDHQDDMNIVFTSHLGDIVENVDASNDEWLRSSAQMAVLDSNGAKSGVAPGNHDMSTSGVAEKFDQYFPVSRYSGFPWYGGHLGGDPQDTVDRKNKDNYELFSAGGLDFIILHLEYDIPAYVIEWANRILDQYPDRRAIISTHAFLNTSNNRPTSPIYRPDGTGAADVWTQLVKPNCNVFLVVNGHYPGEGRRTDLNDCGDPVHQVLTDYQSRANGGDGWLRYYTFKPTENKIYAYTYSPSRLGGAGEFETDASSQFTLDYDMQFQTIGSVTVPSESDAEVSWPDRSAGGEYEWYVTVSDGQKTTTSPMFSFTTTDQVPAPQPPVADFDGDGDTDLSVFRPSQGAWYIAGQPPFPQLWGASGDLSVSADYDGDGSSRHRRLPKRALVRPGTASLPADLGPGRRRPRARRLRRRRRRRHRRLPKRALVRAGTASLPADLGPGRRRPRPRRLRRRRRRGHRRLPKRALVRAGTASLPADLGPGRRRPRPRRLRRRRRRRHRRLPKRALVRAGTASLPADLGPGRRSPRPR